MPAKWNEPLMTHLKKFPLDLWEEEALAAGVDSALAQLGRAVMREHYQHAWDRFHGEVGPHAGSIMIDLALRNPARAKDRWTHLLHTDGERRIP